MEDLKHELYSLPSNDYLLSRVERHGGHMCIQVHIMGTCLCRMPV